MSKAINGYDESRGHGREGVRVVVTDIATGDVLGDTVVHNDYLLVCSGNRYLKNIQRMGTTYMLAIAREKPDGAR